MANGSRQSQGGKARADKLSKEQRSEIARRAAEERWGRNKNLPRATHGSPDRPLRIGDAEIPCYVLEDGRRVLSLGGIVRSLGMSIGGAGSGQGDRLAKFAGGKAISPFISNELATRIKSPVQFRTGRGGSVASGYEAEILPDICEAVLEARSSGALLKQQYHIAEQCEMLVRSFAKVGIVALVDEATGYQYERDRDDLHALLAKYLSEERLAWAKRFPDEFYRQLYRLKGWPWPNGGKRTPYVGKLTNWLVYERLPEGVLSELQRRNPTQAKTQRRKHKHHQFLSEDIGQPDLRDHLLQVVAVMRASRTWDAFVRNFEEAFPKPGTQMTLSIDSSE